MLLPIDNFPICGGSKIMEVRFNRRRAMWGALAAAGIALTIACGGTGSDSGSSDGGAKDPTKESPTAEAKTAKVGDKARDGKFEFTVRKIERGKTKVGNQYAGAKAQGEFVFVHVTVKNIGDEPQSFFGDNQKLYSADGKEYSADSEAAIYLEGSESLWEEINPGNQVKGVVIFDVPEGTKLDRVELHDSAFSGGVAVKVT